MKKNKKLFNMRMSDEMKNELKIYSEKLNITMSSLVNIAITEKIERLKK